MERTVHKLHMYEMDKPNTIPHTDCLEGINLCQVQQQAHVSSAASSTYILAAYEEQTSHTKQGSKADALQQLISSYSSSVCCM